MANIKIVSDWQKLCDEVDAEEWADKGCLPPTRHPLDHLRACLKLRKDDPEKLKAYKETVASRAKIAYVNKLITEEEFRQVMEFLGFDQDVEDIIAKNSKKIAAAVRN